MGFWKKDIKTKQQNDNKEEGQKDKQLKDKKTNKKHAKSKITSNLQL